MATYRASGVTHKQDVAAATWTINHNMGRVPGVTVAINFGGKLQVVLPREIEFPSANQVVIRFTNAQTGEARLS